MHVSMLAHQSYGIVYDVQIELINLRASLHDRCFVDHARPALWYTNSSRIGHRFSILTVSGSTDWPGSRIRHSAADAPSIRSKHLGSAGYSDL